MSSIARTVGRYWFVAPILLVVTVVQIGLGIAVGRRPIQPETPQDVAVSFSSQTQQPTLTRVPTFTPTSRPSSTATPSPTSTFPIPTDTPRSVRPTDGPAPSSTATATDMASPAIASPTPAQAATPAPTPATLAVPVGQGQAVRVPILMYHYLSAPPAGADAIRRDLSVSPAQFESHLAYLRQGGYETISFVDLAYAVAQQVDLPAKPVIITFDDGYRDHYENAFPLLRKYDFKATFFVFTEPIQTANVDYLSWDMVVEMHQAGMEFGSHSHTHPDLRSRGIDFVRNEILSSKELIEAHIGGPVRIFCYPAGRYDDITLQVVKEAGFWGAVTTQWGGVHSFENRFELPRVRVRGSDRAVELAQKLNYF